MLCLSAEKTFKETGLGRCLFGHDIINVSENLKPSTIILEAIALWQYVHEYRSKFIIAIN